ncbi:MAG: helix-turn-helix domain-containing protein [Chitinophagales bacterium]
MDKKESILEATLKLTTEIGWVDTSTALIAKEANVGMGTIYRYFQSKEQLFYDLLFN